MKPYSIINSIAPNASGARPNVQYGNIIDQRRYIYALRYVHGRSVLDCASGIGWGAFLMANAGAKKVVGVDLSRHAIADSIKYFAHPCLIFKVSTPEDLIDEDKFDVITCFETIEHVDDPIKFLSALRDLAHDKTVCLLSTPNVYCTGLVDGHPANPYHAKEYSRLELLDLFESAGWEVDEYLGQHIIEKYSAQVINYRKFNMNYWRNYRMRKILGVPFGFFLRLISAIGYNLVDPASSENAIQSCQSHQEPVYHLFRLSLKHAR